MFDTSKGNSMSRVFFEKVRSADFSAGNFKLDLNLLFVKRFLNPSN